MSRASVAPAAIRLSITNPSQGRRNCDCASALDQSPILQRAHGESSMGRTDVDGDFLIRKCPRSGRPSIVTRTTVQPSSVLRYRHSDSGGDRYARRPSSVDAGSCPPDQVLPGDVVIRRLNPRPARRGRSPWIRSSAVRLASMSFTVEVVATSTWLHEVSSTQHHDRSYRPSSASRSGAGRDLARPW